MMMTIFTDYQRGHGHEWADEDLKSILDFPNKKKTPGGAANVSGYRKLRGILNLHTNATDQSFEDEIINQLRLGRIIIVDLSQGDPIVQNLYSERICQKDF